MNEQLIVKNFGPIKDATVDFKRVTVFIGPAGGGKSTLAKLAAIFQTNFYCPQTIAKNNVPTSSSQPNVCFSDYSINNFKSDSSFSSLISDESQKFLQFKDGQVAILLQDDIHSNNISDYDKSNKLVGKANTLLLEYESEKGFLKKKKILSTVMSLLSEADTYRASATETVKNVAYKLNPIYIPSDRSFASSISSSFAGLMRDDIGLPKTLLNFTNSFFQAREEVNGLAINFLGVKYSRQNSKDYINFTNNDENILLLLAETASGIQSVTPLLVLLEHLSRNTEQAQSFIIEEPELNLYPTAQQGLLNWLIEKCTKGENDLTITTHSPYILSHLNLLLYAYQVAEKHPDRKEAVAAIVPEASWINPKEFACYQVENGGVQSLVDTELGLIDTNELDGLSGDAADAFDNLIRLSKGFAIK
jgi:AAA15 family ATPase/GTPase